MSRFFQNQSKTIFQLKKNLMGTRNMITQKIDKKKAINMISSIKKFGGFRILYFASVISNNKFEFTMR